MSTSPVPAGSVPPAPPTSSDSSGAAEQRSVELYDAVRRNDLAKVARLASLGGDVNHQDSLYGWSPLHNAAREGNFDIFKLLVTKGADVNVKDALGQTPLHRAAQKGNKQIVNYLLFVGCDVLARDSLEQSAADLARNEKHEAVHRVLEKAVHKKEKELAEEKRKAEKTLERQKKKEKKQHGKDRAKGPGMFRQRSFSMDDGLDSVIPDEVQRRSAKPQPLGGVKRFSIMLDAFSKKDMDRLESGAGKVHKSQSVQDRGDIWIRYINGGGDYVPASPPNDD